MPINLKLPFSPLLFVLLLIVVLFVPVCVGLHADGFTWSATPACVPETTTTYLALTGPQATVYEGYLDVAFNIPDNSDVAYVEYDWDDTRTWSDQQTIPGAQSIGGASLINYYQQLTAVWTDAVNNTLTFCIRDQYSNLWGDIDTSTYPAQASPPGLFNPNTVEMLMVFHRQTDSTAFSYCTYDGYTVFDDNSITGGTTYDNAAISANNQDGYQYIFYLGVDSDGNPDGYLHYMTYYPSSNAWSDDILTVYPVDTDSTLSAINYVNSTDSYIFVFYKYQGNYSYVSWPSAGGFTPAGPLGYQIGLGGASGPSAVTYYDPYYDTDIVSLFYSNWRADTSEYRIYNAIGLPDSF